MRLHPVPLVGALALAACVAWPASAWAGRPALTEDAGVLARGDCELETFVGRQTSSQEPTLRGGSLQLGCGIGAGHQIALAATVLRSDGQSQRGLSLLGKLALGEAGGAGGAGEAAASFALAWGLQALRHPQASSYHHESSSLTGVATVPLTTALRLHANLGWSHGKTTRHSSTGWALALEQTAAPGLDLLAETFANDRDKSPWIQLGLRWAALPDKLFLDGSLGQQTSGLRPRLFTVGMKAAF